MSVRLEACLAGDEYAMLRADGVIEEALGVELASGDDLELGVHNRWDARPLPERGLTDVLVQRTSLDDDLPGLEHPPGCGAIMRIAQRGELLALGRTAHRLVEVAAGDVWIAAWSVNESPLRRGVRLAVGGELARGEAAAAAGAARPAWLGPMPSGRAGAALIRSWQCQVAFGGGGAPWERVRELAGEKLGVELEVREASDGALAARAIGAPHDFTYEVRANELDGGAWVFPERREHAAVLLVSWTATSLIEPGWVAAALEGEALEVLGFRVAGAMTTDGLPRLMVHAYAAKE